MIADTPANSAAHIPPGDAGVGASEVGLGTEHIAHLVRVVTRQGAGGVFTWTGHGLSPTFTADCTITSSSPGLPSAASPGREAAVLVSGQGLECLTSALTVSMYTVDALVPASYIAASVVAGVAASVVRQLVPRVSGPRSHRQKHPEEHHRPRTHYC